MAASSPPLPSTSHTPCSPGDAAAGLHTDALLQQLQATATEEVLRLLNEEGWDNEVHVSHDDDF